MLDNFGLSIMNVWRFLTDNSNKYRYLNSCVLVKLWKLMLIFDFE